MCPAARFSVTRYRPSATSSPHRSASATPPDFGAARYGYYQTYQRTNADGSVDLVEYSPYEGSAFGYPTRGKTGNLSFSLANNVEMKIKSDKDSTGFKKVSIIDNFALQMSYNMAAKEKP